jgi:hypothetical protein
MFTTATAFQSETGMERCDRSRVSKVRVALILLVATIGGCETRQPQATIIGMWFNSEHNSVLEFKENGALILSNMPLLIIGAEWLIVEKGRVRFQAVGLGAPPPEVCNYEVSADTLRFSGCSLPPLWKRVPS